MIEKAPERCWDCEYLKMNRDLEYYVHPICKKANDREVSFSAKNGWHKMIWCPLEAIPFTDPPPDGCWNCANYDGDRCMAHWNNADPDYYLPDRDDKKPSDYCELHEKDEDSIWEDYFEEDEI